MNIVIQDTLHANCRSDRAFWGDAFWIVQRAAGIYAYSYCHDPLILRQLTSSPAIQLCRSTAALDLSIPDADLVILPHAINPPEEPASVLRHIAADKPAVLVQPSAAILTARKNWNGAAFREPMLSNREDWRGWNKNEEPFIYPQQLSINRIDADGIPAGARALRWIDQWPDAILDERLCIFQSDFIHAIELYRQSPSAWKKGNFIQQAISLFVESIMHAAALPLPDIPDGDADFDLRRDFHAYGWARCMIQDLLFFMIDLPDQEKADRLRWELPAGIIDFSTADAAVWSAARSFDCADKCREQLRQAFRELKRLRTLIAPIDCVMMDTMHAAILFRDYGFAEFDYPALVTEWCDHFAGYAEKYQYRFNIDVGASSHEVMADRYPAACERLASLWQSGSAEFVNGTYAQPYMPYFSWESIARQVEYGQQAIETALGKRVTTYFSQEFGLTPQLPGILASFGYMAASHRSVLCGKTPTERDAAIWWQGADGVRIHALPSHPHRSESDFHGFFANIAFHIFVSQLEGLTQTAFTSGVDIFSQIPCRDEAIRTAAYAPVFFTFLTYTDYFDAHPPRAARQYGIADYEFSAFSFYDWGGGMIAQLQRVAAAEQALLHLESMEALGSLYDGEKARSLDHAWKALLAYQNHDAFIVPRTPCGGHTAEFIRRGPMRPLSIEQAAREVLDSALAGIVSFDAGRAADFFSRRCADKGAGNGRGYIMFNLHLDQKTRWVILDAPDEGREWFAGDRQLPRHADAGGCAVRISMPAMSWQVVHQAPGDPGTATTLPVITADDALHNEYLSVYADRATGGIAKIVSRSDKTVLCRESNILASGTHSRAVCDELWFRAEGYRATIFSTGTLFGAKGDPLARFASTQSLCQGERLIRIHTRLFPVKRCEEKPYAKKTELRSEDEIWKTAITATFNFGDIPLHCIRICGTMGEETTADRFISHTAAIIDRGDGWRIALHNSGNHHYTRNGCTLGNVLYQDREDSTELDYALECVSESVSPVYIAERHKGALSAFPIRGMTGDTSGSGAGRLAICDARDIILTSMRQKGDEVCLRLAEVAGKPQTARLRFPEITFSARLTSYCGSTIRDLAVAADALVFDIAPWQVVEVRITVYQSSNARSEKI